jgi:anti-sigma-K factor RskA
MRLHGSDLHTLAGAYAMDALADADRARFERHLAGCEACRQEIRGLREATARLAAATAVQPPPALREATLRAVARTRQLPPVVGGAGVSARPAALRRWRRWRSGPAVRLGPAGRWRLAGLAGGLVVVVAAVAVAVGVIVGGSPHPMDAAQLRNHTIAAVLNAPDATMLTARVRTGGTATVVMSHHEHALVFMAAHLSALAAGEGYELWLMSPGGDRAVGMLPGPSRAGMVGPMVISGVAARDSVGLTVEPDGGVLAPTVSPVLMIRLSS